MTWFKVTSLGCYMPNNDKKNPLRVYVLYLFFYLFFLLHCVFLGGKCQRRACLVSTLGKPLSFLWPLRPFVPSYLIRTGCLRGSSVWAELKENATRAALAKCFHFRVKWSWQCWPHVASWLSGLPDIWSCQVCLPCLLVCHWNWFIQYNILANCRHLGDIWRNTSQIFLVFRGCILLTPLINLHELNTRIQWQFSPNTLEEHTDSHELHLGDLHTFHLL